LSFSFAFPFSPARRIPALAAEFTLLNIAELYLRPRGDVNHGENRTQRSNRDKKSQNLAREYIGRLRVVDPRDLVKEARRVRAALGYLEVEMGVEIEPRNDGLGPEGAAAGAGGSISPKGS
jgi:hypothetical protein